MTEAAVETAPEAVAPERVECMIHLRFNLDGTCAEIGERPKGVGAHDWFKYLSRNTSNKYQALAGGRGLFRLPRPQVETLQAGCLAELNA